MESYAGEGGEGRAQLPGKCSPLDVGPAPHPGSQGLNDYNSQDEKGCSCEEAVKMGGGAFRDLEFLHYCGGRRFQRVVLGSGRKGNGAKLDE